MSDRATKVFTKANEDLTDADTPALASKQLADDHNVTVSNMIPAVETGLATSAKQLADGHNVTANAGTNLNTSALATEATMTADLQSIEDNQTDGTQKTKITDGTDDADVISTNGNKGLVTISPGHISTDNSTATPLIENDTFVGEWEDITNFGIIVITVKASHASATDGLEVEFSSDGTNVDSTDCYTIPADAGKTFSFQAATQYFRVKYTNGGTEQTSFRLQTILKPYYVKPSSHRITDAIIGDDDAELVKAVLTGINPEGIFTNVETTYDNSLKTSLIDGEIGTRAEIEPLGSLKTVTPTRLVGTTFSNGTKDTNFWTETLLVDGEESELGSGSVTQAGEIILETGTTANSGARYETVEKARKITGKTNQFRLVGRQQQEATADCIRRAGAYDANNGFFFQYDGTTFQVVSRKNTVDTAVSNGSFNGNAGETVSVDETEFVRLTIDYTALSAKFFVNGTLIHTIMANDTSLTNTLNLPVTMEIINENDNTDDNGFEVLFATILGLGEIATAPKSYYQAGTTAGVVLKYNAGALRGVVISGVQNNSVITLYDNTAASGKVLWSSGAMGSQTQPFDIDFRALSFSIGLTLVISDANSNITVIYE